MTVTQQFQKPSIDEWTRVAETVADRLTECVHTYKHNTYIFMAESERQHKTSFVIKILQGLHSLLDQAEMPSELVANTQESDEQVIVGLTGLFNESLEALPWISTDMQKLLKSPWMKGFPDKVAQSLFWGNGDESKGIGSGLPEHGRLPGVLSRLLEQEAMGDVRPPRDSSAGEPCRHDVDASTRWAEQNRDFLRKAGRVD